MSQTELISFMLSGKRRCDVLATLLLGDYTAKEIAQITFISYQYVLLKLEELYQRGLVLHNNAKRNRIYSITSEGKELMAQILDRYNSACMGGYK